ncbi:hypothetical protein [Thermacetogenium phaeum]|uniref:hypothetical protein n=1 Tax=Thermacetogenium phaeum TaxID=85874 RepID=UPI0002D58682|nr:hypothetical protein [Thermacetogenium phaeum]
MCIAWLDKEVLLTGSMLNRCGCSFLVRRDCLVDEASGEMGGGALKGEYKAGGRSQSGQPPVD